MHMRRIGTVAKGLAVTMAASAAALTAGVGTAHADPTWEPDPNAAAPYGNVAFFDASGNQIYGGSDLTHVADYALASSDGDPSADGGSGAKATMYFANPTPGQATGDWPTSQASASTAYPKPSAPGALGTSTHPLVTLTAADGNLSSFIGGHTANTQAGYTNVYQVRVQDIGPNGGSGSHYWETDIQVDPNAGTWTQLYPTPPSVPQPPGAPTLDTAAPGNGTVALSWTAGSGSGIDDYRVSYSPTGGNAPTVVDLVSAATSGTISGLANGTSYTFQVAAHNANGWGGYSNSLDAIAGGLLTGLTITPGLLAVGSDHHASITATVAWDASSLPPSASGVRVCLQPATAAAASFASCPSGVVQDVAGTNQTTFSGLASGPAYRATAWPNYGGSNGGGSASQSVAGSALTSPSSQLVRYGAWVTLSTKLVQTGTTTPLVAAPVQLWRKPAGSSVWSLVTTRTTGSTGVASYALKPLLNTVFEWRYTGAAGHLATTTLDRVAAAFAVTNVLTKLKVVHGTQVHIYGTVAPAAHYALVYLQKNGHIIAKMRITLRKLPNGKKVWGFDFVFKPTAKGKYKLRIFKPATTKDAAGYGRTLVLTAT